MTSLPQPFQGVSASKNEQRLLAVIEAIQREAKLANDVIRLKRDEDGQGRIKVATAMHRIAHLCDAALHKGNTNVQG